MDRSKKGLQRLLIMLVVVLLGGCASPQAMPLTDFGALPATATKTEAPSGFISFCTRFADQCRAQQASVGPLTLDTKNWLLLSSVNQTVNDAIVPQEDSDHYGRAEYWTIPTDGRGDCDDYAVTKRKDLLASGIASSALRLAVVDTPRDGRHAVLTVATDKGDLVLDNLTSNILPWNRTGFTLVEVQDRINPMQWDTTRPSFAAAQDSGGRPTTAARVGATR